MPTTPVKNICGPENVYGGFTQTLFLGCSVSTFSVSAGWNEQVDEVTVQVVQDLCSGSTRLYYDDSLIEQTTTNADPGFIGHAQDIIGCPVYFRVGDFEFTGIVQSWEQVDQHALHSVLPVKGVEFAAEAGGTIPNDSLSVYQIKISDPRELLENAQIIINEYAGGVGGMDNIVNAFGYLENIDPVCSDPGFDQGVDGRIFGTPNGGFGGADSDSNGVSWNRIVQGARVLLSGTANTYSNGFVAFRGESATATTPNGMGLIGQSVLSPGETHYIVDMAEVPSIPNSQRMNGLSVSLLNMITEVCQKAGYDYYVELIPVDSTALGLAGSISSAGGVACVIKIRTINRNAQPTLGQIDDFIDAQNDARGTKANSVGLELRNGTTEQLVIGGFKQNVFDTDQSGEAAADMIYPHFGVYASSGDAIVPVRDINGDWEFEAETDELTHQLEEYDAARWGAGGTHVLPLLLTITEQELQAALVSFDVYIMVAMHKNTDMAQAMDFKNIYDPIFLAAVIAKIDAAAGNKAVGRDIFHLGNNLLRVVNNAADAKLVNGFQAAFEFIRQFATEYYGKQFQVRVPYVCARVPTTSGFVSTWDGHILFTDEPNDGGWSELETLLGLDNPDAPLDFFRMEDMRIQPILRFSDAGELNIVTKLDRKEYLVDVPNNNLYVKAGINPDWVFTDKSVMPPADVTAIRAVLTMSQGIQFLEGEQGDPAAIVDGLKLLINKVMNNPNNANNHVAAAQDAVGGDNLNLPWSHVNQMPDGALVPTKSNVLTYGPWSSAGPAGAAVVQHEEGLVPWEYGSYDAMGTAGAELSTEGITLMQQADEGTVTIAGYPTNPLHAELGSTTSGGRYFPVASSNALFGNRSLAATGGALGTYYTINMGGAWTGSTGPNITGITIQVGDSGLETVYTMRSHVPTFGRFARGNAERLKQIGQSNMRAARTLRAFTFQRTKAQVMQAIGQAVADKRALDAAMKPQNHQKQNSPHEYLVGQAIDWNGGQFKRMIIASKDIKSAQADFTDYDQKAFMSWDGLFTPISMDGYASLPQYATPLDGCQNTHSKGSQPPIDKSGEAGNFSQYNLDIQLDDLNPWSNPTSLARSEPANRSDTPTIGHNIDIIGREGESGTVPPASSIVMPIQGMLDGAIPDMDYKADYGGFGIKGPVIVGGWGYDLDGFPVPNAADTAANASGGNFTATNLQHKFLDNFLRQPHTHPVGPIDLRWDRERGCWVSPPGFRLVCGQLTENLVPGGSALANLINGPTLYDTGGSTFSNAQFYVHDCVQESLFSGDYVMADYDPRTCQYNNVHSNKVQIIRFENTSEKVFGADCSGERLDENNVKDGVTIGMVDAYGVYGPVTTGAKGYAARFPDRTGVTLGGTPYDAYEILFMEDPARFIEVTLTENMSNTTAGEAFAAVNDYYGNPTNGMNPGTGLNVQDNQGLFTRALNGAKGYAVFDERTNEYNLVRCQTKAEGIAFTLNADLSGAGSVSGTVTDYWRGQSPGANINLLNVGGDFFMCFSGAAGIATYDDRSDDYHIVECEQNCPMYLGQTNGALATGDAAILCDGLIPLGWGVDAEASVSGQNTFNAETDNDGYVVVVWSRDNADWVIIQAQCTG